MAYQRDPDQLPDPRLPRDAADPRVRERPREYLRRNDFSFGVLPGVLIVALLLGLGLLLFATSGNQGTDRQTTSQRTESPATPPATTPPRK